MATYNSKDVFSHLYEQLERLYNMKCEYNKNSADALLLEIFYQTHVVETLDSILWEKMKEEEPSLSNKEQNELQLSQYQMHNEGWDDSEGDHDHQMDEESVNGFWTADWGIGYDYKNEVPILSQIHKNEPKEDENAPPLSINNIGPCEALPNDWKGLFFMFRDDNNLVKEESSNLVDNFNDSSEKEIKEDASISRATDKGFFFMFE